jgi:hypothetical protein
MPANAGSRNQDAHSPYRLDLGLLKLVSSRAPTPLNPSSWELSPVYLRLDFETQYTESFLNSLELYHKYHYEQAAEIVDEYFSQLPTGISTSATSSFKVLKHLIQLQQFCVWPGPNTKDWSNTVHIEDTIASVAHCAREWLFLKSEEDVIRKHNLDDFLLFALNEIRDNVPMPPNIGAVITDVKVCLPAIFYCLPCSLIATRFLAEFSITPF